MSRTPASPIAHVGGRPVVLLRPSRATPTVPRPQPPRPVTREAAVQRAPSRRLAPRWRMADTAFRLTALAFALSVLAITGTIAVELFVRSAPARRAFGWSFLWTGVWDPVFSKFGALPFIYGTLATTAIALAIATPLGLGAAICLAESSCECPPAGAIGSVGAIGRFTAASPSSEARGGERRAGKGG